MCQGITTLNNRLGGCANSDQVIMSREQILRSIGRGWLLRSLQLSRAEELMIGVISAPGIAPGGVLNIWSRHGTHARLENVLFSALSSWHCSVVLALVFRFWGPIALSLIISLRWSTGAPKPKVVREARDAPFAASHTKISGRNPQITHIWTCCFCHLPETIKSNENAPCNSGQDLCRSIGAKEDPSVAYNLKIITKKNRQIAQKAILWLITVVPLAQDIKLSEEELPDNQSANQQVIEDASVQAVPP